jgi:hypothetical protein
MRAACAGLRDAVRGAHMHAERGEPISRRLQAHIYLAGMHAALQLSPCQLELDWPGIHELALLSVP